MTPCDKLNHSRNKITSNMYQDVTQKRKKKKTCTYQDSRHPEFDKGVG